VSTAALPRSMDFHLDRAEQKLRQQRKKEEAQRKREAAKRAAAKAKAQREAAALAERLAPALDAQRQQLEALQSQREAAERERAQQNAVVKGAGRKMRRAAGPQLCFRGAPPPQERLDRDRETILREEPEIVAAVTSVDPGALVELLLERFGAKGSSASARNNSARQERCRVCNALRLSMASSPDTAFALGLAAIDRLAQPKMRARPQADGSCGGKAQKRNPTLPMCLLLDSLMATGLVPSGSDTELAESFVLGALRRPGWFAVVSTEPEPEPEPEPESEPDEQRAGLELSPRVLVQLMHIFGVRAASIPFAGVSEIRTISASRPHTTHPCTTAHACA
jgi:hypothetical protein